MEPLSANRWPKIICTVDFRYKGVLVFSLRYSARISQSHLRHTPCRELQNLGCKLFIERKINVLQTIFQNRGVPRVIVVPHDLAEVFRTSDKWGEVICNHFSIMTITPDFEEILNTDWFV